MSRSTLALDRLATVLLSLLLLAAGAAGIWWWSDRSPFGTTVDTTAAGDAVAQAWFPWAGAAVGVLLVLLGLRWILAHLRRQNVAQLHLAGSGPSGRLDVVGSKVAGAAAAAFSDTLGVRSARGVVVRDRGQLVARISAVIEPECDLALVARQADLVSAQLVEALGRDDLRCSVQLRVGTFARRLPRAS